MPKGKPTYIPNDGLTTTQRRNKPMLIINTGEGKGKTTAAFGMAMRAWHQGWRIGVFQFIKSASWKTGEQHVFSLLNEINKNQQIGGPVEWYKMGGGWSWKHQADISDQAAMAQEGWLEVKRRLANETHDFYVLDEFTYPMYWGWLDISQVVDTLRNRPGHQHIVITGRNCPTEIIEIADLVTNMTKIKHPFDIGQKGQKGIEW